jgi:hypothetical protein
VVYQRQSTTLLLSGEASPLIIALSESQISAEHLLGAAQAGASLPPA